MRGAFESAGPWPGRDKIWLPISTSKICPTGHACSARLARPAAYPTALLGPLIMFFSNPHSKPFRNRFGTVFEAILAPKMVQKSTKNRSKINVCTRLRFLIDFLIKNLS